MSSEVEALFTKAKKDLIEFPYRRQLTAKDSSISHMGDAVTADEELKENFGQFAHAASLLKLPLTCQYRRREHIWSNYYRAP